MFYILIMPWGKAEDELQNYTVFPNTDKYCPNVSWNMGNRFEWGGAQTGALWCNQDDACHGFAVYSNGQSGWLFRQGCQATPKSPAQGTTFYEKKSTSFRKASQPDLNADGVISDPVTKVKIHDWSGDRKTSLNPGYHNCGSDPVYKSCNTSDGIFVPLGWTAEVSNDCERVTNHGFFDGKEGDLYDGIPLQNYSMPANTDDCVIVQNLGFDVKRFFSSMTTKGVETEDAVKIRQKWCSKPENVNDILCTNFYNSPEAKAAGYNYNSTKFEIVRNQPNWQISASNRTFINELIRGTDQSLKQRAIDLVGAYCNTPAGEAQADGVCACANVVKYGAACLTTKSTIPGCAELKATLGSLPQGAKVAFSDVFCASTDCVTETIGGSALLPGWAGKNCPDIQQCVQTFNDVNFVNSPVRAECNQVLNITGVPPPPASGGTPPASGGTPPASGGTPPASGGTPPASGGTPPASRGTPPASGGTPPASGGTPPASGGTPPASEDTLWAADTIPGLDTKPKQIGFILIIICCCMIIFGIVLYLLK
jgi:hypothetical protein